MKTIYLDSEYVCHLENGEGRQAIQTDAFDGRCDEYINRCRFVPSGQTWTREDGTVFQGEMLCVLDISAMTAQTAYEQAQAEDLVTIGGLMNDIEALCNELIGE